MDGLEKDCGVAKRWIRLIIILGEALLFQFLSGQLLPIVLSTGGIVVQS